jgi:hypothetical protein
MADLDLTTVTLLASVVIIGIQTYTLWKQTKIEAQTKLGETLDLSTEHSYQCGIPQLS